MELKFHNGQIVWVAEHGDCEAGIPPRWLSAMVVRPNSLKEGREVSYQVMMLEDKTKVRKLESEIVANEAKARKLTQKHLTAKRREYEDILFKYRNALERCKEYLKMAYEVAP